MPYITKQQKKELLIDTTRFPVDAGELNYALTLIVLHYFQRSGGRYQQINDVIGALEGCKAEFQRRVVAPYEDKKIKENGDVYK